MLQVIATFGFGLVAGLVAASKWDDPKIVANNVGRTYKMLCVTLCLMMLVPFSLLLSGAGDWDWRAALSPSGALTGFGAARYFLWFKRNPIQASLFAIEVMAGVLVFCVSWLAQVALMAEFLRAVIESLDLTRPCMLNSEQQCLLIEVSIPLPLVIAITFVAVLSRRRSRV